jgi:anti-sigma factor ChrR (cupin superfamily)
MTYDNDIAPIALELSPIPLYPERLAALRARIKLAPIPRGYVPAQQNDAKTVLPGVQVRRLLRDGEFETTLWTLEPGAQIPAHSHRLAEDCVVLEGCLEYAGRQMRKGDFLRAEATETQGRILAIEASVLLIRAEARAH